MKLLLAMLPCSEVGLFPPPQRNIRGVPCAMKAKVDKAQVEVLQANYASVVGLLETAESEKKQVQHETARLQQRLEGAEVELEAARRDKDVAAEQMAASSAKKDAVIAECESDLEQLRLEVTTLRSSTHTAEEAAEARVAEVQQQAATAANSAAVAAQQQAAAASAAEGRMLHAEEATRAREASQAAREASRAAEGGHAARLAVAALGGELNALEEALAQIGPVALASSEAAARAAAADLSVERMREETKRAVGAERQRVAGMLYKEALQTHTLEEQALQIDELTAELTVAKQRAADRDRLVAERDQTSAELQALAESRSEHVQSILNLDDQLACEQQARQEVCARHVHCTHTAYTQYAQAAHLTRAHSMLAASARRVHCVRAGTAAAAADADCAGRARRSRV